MELDTNITGLRALFLYSARKMLVRRRWLLFALLALLVVGVMAYGASQQGADAATGSNMLDLFVLTFLLPVLALIYGASMIRNEIDDRSIIQVITSPIDRRFSYVGYYLALVLVMMLLTSLLVILGGATYFLISGSGGDAGAIIGGYIIVCCIGSMAYSSLFLMFGVAMKQPLYLGLFYVFIWEYFVGTVPGAIGQYTIRHQLQVIGSGLIGTGNIAGVGGDGGLASGILMVLVIVAVLIGALIFWNKEVA
jgi:ABC-2 type transport system permease protein